MIKLIFLHLVFVTNALAYTGKSSFSVNANELRQSRKIGTGFQMLGASGVGGLTIDMNFGATWSLNLGYGLAPDFQAFHVEYKQYMNSERLVPYGTIGFARWYGKTDGPIESTNPNFLAKDLLSSKDRRSGEINENLIYPGAGLQYFNLSGDWAGFSLFAQVILLIDVQDFVFVPTVGLGTSFYF